jgi:hypothetical protein
VSGFKPALAQAGQGRIPTLGHPTNAHLGVAATGAAEAGSAGVDTGTADEGSAVVDVGSTVVDVGSTVVDVGSTVVDVGSTVVDVGSTVVDVGSTVAEEDSITVAGLVEGSKVVEEGTCTGSSDDCFSADWVASELSGTTAGAGGTVAVLTAAAGGRGMAGWGVAVGAVMGGAGLRGRIELTLTEGEAGVG